MSALEIVSDDIYHLICSYLDPDEKIQWIMINKSLQRHFLKKYRQIDIVNRSPVWQAFFIDPSLREKILSLIENPYHQLSYSMISASLTPILPIAVPSICSVHQLTATFLQFQSNREIFHRINSLTLIQREGEGEGTQKKAELFQSVLQYLVNHSISDEESSLGLRNLSIKFETENAHATNNMNNIHGNNLREIPLIPHLVSLELIKIAVVRLPDQYRWLHQLLLKDCEYLIDVTPFGDIHCLTLSGCPNITEIRSLQKNHSIIIEKCSGIKDYSKSFQSSVHISINFPADSTFELPDFAFLKKVQSLKLLRADHQHLPSVLPATLRYYFLSNVGSHLITLHNLHFLKHLVIVASDSVCSVSTFGSIPILELASLKNLLSLEGLGKGNKNVRISYCNGITDFSPLRCVNQVAIDYCIGFRKIEEVDHVHHLKIGLQLEIGWISEHIWSVTDFSPLGKHIYHLHLNISSQSADVVSLKGLENIQVIEISIFWVMDIRLLEELVKGNHQKIIFVLHRTKFQSLPIPTSNVYHRYFFSRKDTIVYLRK